MITFMSTRTNDFALNDDKSLELITGIQGVVQLAKQHMQARRAEMFLNANRGMPLAELAWAGEPNIAQFEAAGRATLLQVTGVVEVPEFTARLVDDELRYVARIRTIYGEAPLNGTV